MALTKQQLLFCFLILNINLVILNVTGTWNYLWDYSNKRHMVTLTLLDEPTNLQNFLGSSNKATEDVASPPALHPFDKLSRRLEQLDWNPHRIDEALRKYWKTGKTFLENQVDKQNNMHTTLSTSCLHTAAWIVVGLLELQTRPNLYIGLYRLPKDENLIIYNNTQKPPSALATPVIQSLRTFIDSRPSNESIILQVDMHQIRSRPTPYYIDHHFALHIFNGQISLYQGWQDTFNLIDWMKNPAAFKLRYPMPIDTFLAHFETFLTYTEEENQRRKRLEATWEIFGTTETFVYGKKEVLDTTVRALRYPWVVSLITHWPNPQE